MAARARGYCDAYDRIDRGIDLLGAGDAEFNEFASSDFTLCHERGERNGVMFPVLVKPHRVSAVNV